MRPGMKLGRKMVLFPWNRPPETEVILLLVLSISLGCSPPATETGDQSNKAPSDALSQSTLVSAGHVSVHGPSPPAEDDPDNMFAFAD